MVQIYKKAPRTPKEAACCQAPIDVSLEADVFKALGDKTRLNLLACLIKCARPCSVTEIAECCSVDLSVVSRHLKILEDAEVIRSYKEGRTVWYEVETEKVVALLRDIADGMEECSGKAAKLKNKVCC